MKTWHCMTTAALALHFASATAGATTTVKKVDFQRADGVTCHVSLSIDRPTWPASIWGAEGAAPETLASALHIRCKDGAVKVPAKAFADLGNPLWIAVELAERGYDVVINGAQGPLAYVARLHVENRAVVARDVASTTLPGVAEHASYREEET